MRTVTCVVCNHVGSSDDFVVYGGIDNDGYGTCRTCFCDIPFSPVEPSMFPFWYHEYESCYGTDVGSSLHQQTFGDLP